MLTKAALLSYERLHVTKGILDREWQGQTKEVAYVSKVIAAWHFDMIASGAASPMRLPLISAIKARPSHANLGQETLRNAADYK